MTKQHKPKKRKKLKKNIGVKKTEYKTVLMQTNSNFFPIEFWCSPKFYDKLEKFSDTQKSLRLKEQANG